MLTGRRRLLSAPRIREAPGPEGKLTSGENQTGTHPPSSPSNAFPPGRLSFPAVRDPPAPPRLGRPARPVPSAPPHPPDRPHGWSRGRARAPIPPASQPRPAPPSSPSPSHHPESPCVPIAPVLRYPQAPRGRAPITAVGPSDRRAAERGALRPGQRLHGSAAGVRAERRGRDGRRDEPEPSIAPRGRGLRRGAGQPSGRVVALRPSWVLQSYCWWYCVAAWVRARCPCCASLPLFDAPVLIIQRCPGTFRNGSLIHPRQQRAAPHPALEEQVCFPLAPLQPLLPKYLHLVSALCLTEVSFYCFPQQ